MPCSIFAEIFPGSIAGSSSDTRRQSAAERSGICAAIYFPFASDLKQKTPSRWAWGVVKNPNFSRTRDRHNKHVFDLVPDQIFDAGTRRAKVFARIEFLRIFRKNLRMPAVMARRRSVSMLTFVQPRGARLRCGFRQPLHRASAAYC